MADKIVVMQNGVVVDSGTREEVINNPKSDYTKKLLKAIPEMMVRDLSKNNELILEARNLTKQFKVSKSSTLTACDNINLSMYKGKTLGIVGESGCGKSTFLRMLMNLEPISSGEIFIREGYQ